jgi:prolyl-tRNA synthetase
MNATVTGPAGEETYVEMGSYGIGVSRLVAAIIEASHDDAGIVWPRPVAPFAVGLINVKQDDPDCAAVCEGVYAALNGNGKEALYDDRPERAGVKFAEMDLIGLPDQIIVGPRGAKSGKVELKSRRTGERWELGADEAVAQVTCCVRV